MKIRLPIRGVSDVTPDSETPLDTSKLMVNWRGIDPRTKKVRFSTRSGTVKYLDDALPAAVRALRSVTFQRKALLHQDKVSGPTTPLGSADVSHSWQTPSKSQVRAIDTDDEQGVYVMDGRAGIAKYNATGDLIWKLSAPVKQDTAIIRALRVGRLGIQGADRIAVFFGVSEGGRQGDAFLACYKQTSERDEDGDVVTKTEKVWLFEPNAYTEKIRLLDNRLYTIQNEPDKGRAWLRVYSNLTTEGEPTLNFKKEVPYPANGLDVNADGEIIVASANNEDRGIDPRLTGYCARDLALEFNLKDHLTDYDKRIWTDLDATRLGTNLELEDGDQVTVWLDETEGFRSLKAQSEDIEDQPRWVENGIGGQPAIRWNGATGSGASALTPSLQSDNNPSVQKQFDDQQRTILPAFKDGRYIAFIVARFPHGSGLRPVFYQDNETSQSGTECDQLIANGILANAGGVITNQERAGKVFWATSTHATATGMGPLMDNAGTFRTAWWGEHTSAAGSGVAIITICHDARVTPGTDTVQHSFLRVNGKPLDRYASLQLMSRLPTVFGLGSSGLTNPTTTFPQCDIARIIVLRDYTDGGAHGNPATGNLSTSTIAGTYATVTGVPIAVGDQVTGSTGGWTMYVESVTHVGPNGSFTGWLLSGTSVGAGAETLTGPAGTWTGVTLTGGTAGVSTATRHYPRVVGGAGSQAVPFFAVAMNRYNDNEIERIEGMLAGIYGVSHLLPGGTASVLTVDATWTNGDTVTIGSRTYTMVTALTPANSNEVLRGGNAYAGTRNLYLAINGSGTPGTDYSEDMTPHPTVRATAISDGLVSTAAAYLKVETQTETAIACSETATSAGTVWSNATTSTQATNTASVTAYMPGHYPHPFSRAYGFPRPDTASAVGITQESKGKMMTSLEGILTKLDPTGKVVWVATSRDATQYPHSAYALTGVTLPASNEHHGGIGWDCAWGTGEDDKAVYSTGPRYSTSPSTDSELAVLRRMIDNGDTVSLSGTGTWVYDTIDLVDANSEQSLADNHVQIVVDEFDNVWLPWRELTPANDSIMSLVMVEADGTIALTFRMSNTTSNPAGLCVALDKKQPEYDGDPATRQFAVFLGTYLGNTVDDTTQDNVYRIEGVSATLQEGVAPSETRLCAISNGELWTSLSGGALAEPAGVNTLSNPVFATETDAEDAYVSLVSLNSHLYGTDGLSYLDYNPRTDVIEEMRCRSAGELKPRARAVSAWRGRLVWYRFSDNPTEYLMSAVGRPYDYDIGVFPPTATMAVLGTRAPRGTGQAPDIINTFIPYSDDTAVLGCQSSIQLLDGDPADGGRFILVSDSTGMAFGDSWCKDEYGTIYFFGTRGCVYRMNLSRAVQPLSEDSIPERLRAVDFSVTRPKLLWDNEAQGFHLFLTPTNPLNAESAEHYFWSRQTQGWYPDSFQLTDHQPTATFVGDGDLALNRHAVIGCVDGYIRAFDSTATTDDGELILAEADVGPHSATDLLDRVRAKGLTAELATAQGSCGYQFFVSDEADAMGLPVHSDVLEPGRNPTHWSAQGSGRYFSIKLSNSTPTGCAIESLDIGVYRAGKVKA